MKSITWLAALAIAIPVAAQADDHDLKKSNTTFEQLPNAVKSTVQREGKGEDIVSIRKEGEQTRVLYRVQLEREQASSGTSANNSQPKIRTLIVSEDGKVVSGGVDRATDPSQLKDRDPDKGDKPSTDSLDKDHIRP